MTHTPIRHPVLLHHNALSAGAGDQKHHCVERRVRMRTDTDVSPASWRPPDVSAPARVVAL